MENRQIVIELLKYPILVLTIVLSLLTLKHCAGLQFGVLTKVGPGGAEFAQQTQATENAVSELEARLNETQVRLAALEMQSKPSTAETRRVETEADSAAQIVSDATAQIAVLRRSTSGVSTAGYIWIGNYKQKWQPAKFARLDTGQPVEIPPMQMTQGTQYRVLGNMVLRDGMPANDQDYFRSRASLGVVPRGTVVSILEPPLGIDREFAVQYWAKVRVAQMSQVQ